MDFRLKFHNIIQSLWEREFNYTEEERYANSKEKIIKHHIQQLRFCDKYKPKTFNTLTSEIAFKIQYMDRLRLKIYEDINKQPGKWCLTGVQNGMLECNGMHVMCNYKDICSKEKCDEPLYILQSEKGIILKSGNYAIRRVRPDGSFQDTILITPK